MRRKKGEGSLDDRGYETRWDSERKCRVKLHILIAEKAYGKPLPPKAVVHHLDGTKENRRGNIAICEDQAYHLLLHQRMDAKAACGNPDWRKCPYCKKYDDSAKMIERQSLNIRGTQISTFVHRECENKDRLDRRRNRHVRP